MDLRTAAEKRFVGVERGTLTGFCDVLGVPYEGTTSVKVLRQSLLDALGVYHELAGGKPATNASVEIETPEYGGDDVTVEDLFRLNLRPQGMWQGRRRIIMLHRAADHVTTYPQFVAWKELHCYVPYGVESSLPYPIYLILENTKAGRRLVRKRKVDEDGRIYYEEQWVPHQRFMYTDLGDDPATAHLPRDIREQYLWLYHKTNQFDGYSLRQIKDMARKLQIYIRGEEAKEWQKSDYLARIKSVIGVGQPLSAPAERTAKKVA